MNPPEKESARAHILVVEDSSVFREMQGLLLGQAGYGVSSHESPQSALEVAAKRHFDLVVIDYELPEMNGQQFMHALRKIQPDIAVIFVSGSLTLELAIQLSSQGVAGIFNKPANPKILLEKINETLARHAARDTAARIGSGSPLPGARRSNSRSPFMGNPHAEPVADRLAYAPRFVLGASDRFREFTHRLWKVRDFRSVLLLHGEAGSPFELLARELAEISIFRDGPIMVCDAGKFEPRGLIEVLAPSLLSHDAGTLVVAGVEQFSLEQQKTLENLISGRDVFLPFARRFRLVLAATSELSERVDDGAFGETLYYKISALSLAVPALREMRGDIVANARRILALQRGAEAKDSPPSLTPEAAEWLESRDWPGNYDELTRTIVAAAPLAENNALTVKALEAAAPRPERTARTGGLAAKPSLPDPAAAPPSSEARPPFPLVSDLMRPPAAVIEPPPDRAAAGPAIVRAPAASAPAQAVARAPARQLFAKAVPAASVRVPDAPSLFRPAASTYNFAQRLAESLVAAEKEQPH